MYSLDSPFDTASASDFRNPGVLDRATEASKYAASWVRSAWAQWSRRPPPEPLPLGELNTNSWPAASGPAPAVEDESSPHLTLPRARPPVPPPLHSALLATSVEAELHAPTALGFAFNDSCHNLHVERDFLDRYPQLQLALQALNQSGGCRAHVVKRPIAHAQILLCGLSDAESVYRRVEEVAAEILQRGVDSVGEERMPLGCFPGISIRRLGQDALLVTFHAEGERNLPAIEGIARGASSTLFRLVDPPERPRIVLGVAQREVLQVSCDLNPESLVWLLAQSGVNLSSAALGGREICHGAVDHHAPDQAQDMNEVVLDCFRSVAPGLALDGNLLERDAREHAGRWGSCEPLVRWSHVEGCLRGQLRVPTSVLTWPSSVSTDRRFKEDNLTALGVLAVSASLATLFVPAEDSDEVTPPPMPAAHLASAAAGRSLPPPRVAHH